MSKRGKFIVIEGGEGAGKDDQIKKLKKILGTDSTVFTREPGDTFVGSEIRSLLLDKERAKTMTVETELMLFSADRAQHIQEVVAPALRRGENTITNRFYFSTIAYQIYGGEKREYLDFFLQLNKLVIGDCIPDMAILLDVTPEVGLARKKKQLGDKGLSRFDSKSVDYHTRVREGFLEHISSVPHRIIDADQSKEAVWKEFSESIFGALNIAPK